eukprot:TRINITY_DN11124_c0_g1_i1.p1 TRINITY_DN11124_c0_g1~~TRINITY_DN11124_c0_g1_i1.p1  ORF type:complete len:462 (-),score=46.25 TRINITY_DN11124_c0_g1_i1:239-1624(-)
MLMFSLNNPPSDSSSEDDESTENLLSRGALLNETIEPPKDHKRYQGAVIQNVLDFDFESDVPKLYIAWKKQNGNTIKTWETLDSFSSDPTMSLYTKLKGVFHTEVKRKQQLQTEENRNTSNGTKTSGTIKPRDELPQDELPERPRTERSRDELRSDSRSDLRSERTDSRHDPRRDSRRDATEPKPQDEDGHPRREDRTRDRSSSSSPMRLEPYHRSDPQPHSRSDAPSHSSRSSQHSSHRSGSEISERKRDERDDRPSDRNVKPRKSRTERQDCWHGATCYNRTEEHRKEFRHHGEPASYETEYQIKMQEQVRRPSNFRRISSDSGVHSAMHSNPSNPSNGSSNQASYLPSPIPGLIYRDTSSPGSSSSGNLPSHASSSLATTSSGTNTSGSNPTWSLTKDILSSINGQPNVSISAHPTSDIATVAVTSSTKRDPRLGASEIPKIPMPALVPIPRQIPKPR